MKKLLVAAFAMAAMASSAGGSGLRYSIMVNKFENKANWRGQWELGDAWGTILTDQLVQSGHFIVLGEADMRGAAMQEQDLAASGRTAGGKKAPKMGRMTPAQLLVKGAITHVQETKGAKGGFGFKGISLGGGGDSTEINVTIYVCDSATGQVKASKTVIGKSGGRGLGIGYHGSKLGGLTGDLAGFEKDNMGKACTDAVAQAVEFLVAQLDAIPWEGTVSLAKPDKLIVNRGTRDGVAVGMKFDIGKVEEVVDDDTGEVIDSSMTKLGTVTVTEVKEKVSYTTPLEGAEKGMGVHPAK
ncbi:MAG: CsgG/HfaB family protein [Kiritimatiellae bacterium]|nr:CsgG/HfaB family protein [Kiritimatiellia bacterium]